MLNQADKRNGDQSEEFARRFPHRHRFLAHGPDVTRRRFFEVAGTGLLGSYLAGKAEAAEEITAAGVVPRNSAKNVIFIHLLGAISAIDTFDLKAVTGSSTRLNPAKINGIDWPAGLLPKLGGLLGDVAIVRSMSAWALVHSLAQTWAQIGRNPAAALGDIAPNMGSIVAIEKDVERKSGQVFPAFVALNAPASSGGGYLPATFAPFRINGAGAGIPNTVNNNPGQQAGFNTMFSRLHQLDDPLRVRSPYGTRFEDYDAFYAAAKGLMYNPAVSAAFAVIAADSQRYGNTPFGNACLVAKQMLAANQGTRFIQIDFGSWDMHGDIYGQQNPNGNNLFRMGPQLDNGVSAMLADLKSSGLLNETLVVIMGEFGRTAAISAAGGRDHYLVQSVVFAGGGVKGGKVIGATTPDASRNIITVSDYGWKGSGNTGPRLVRPEDVEATIYDAMGIDYTKVRMDDPYRRGFEYVPFGAQGAYGPINELF